MRSNRLEQLIAATPGARRAAMPRVIEPMLATLVDKPFDDPDWLFETKWDGVRAVCYLDRGRLRFVSRNQKEMGFRYPELAEIKAAITARRAIFDGEIVAFDKRGRSNFQFLQSRIGLQGEEDIRAEMRAHPVVYCAFDLLYCDGFDLMGCELARRKAILGAAINDHPHLKLSEHTTAGGIKAFRQAERRRLEGIMAKHRRSLYVQERSSEWLKIKTVLRQEVVITGYTEPRGARPLFGALVVGLYADGELRYVGHVGGGFNRQSLEQVYKRMQPLKARRSPFREPPHTNEPVQWLKPQMVCEVKFSEWTEDYIMRHPIFEGLRDDKEPRQCRIEWSREAARVVEKVDAKAI